MTNGKSHHESFDEKSMIVKNAFTYLLHIIKLHDEMEICSARADGINES